MRTISFFVQRVGVISLQICRLENGQSHSFFDHTIGKAWLTPYHFAEFNNIEKGNGAAIKAFFSKNVVQCSFKAKKQKRLRR